MIISMCRRLLRRRGEGEDKEETFGHFSFAKKAIIVSAIYERVFVH